MIKQLIEDLEELREKEALKAFPYATVEDDPSVDTKDAAINSAFIDGIDIAIKEAKKLQDKVRCENCLHYDERIIGGKCGSDKNGYCDEWEEKE